MKYEIFLHEKKEKKTVNHLIVVKANRVLGLTRRTFRSKDPVAIKTAFNALVRPILEYACPVWNPYLVKHIHSIESIQRRATRLICGSDNSWLF